MKYAAAVTIYNLDENEVINNINSYIHDVDVVYVLDNTKDDRSDFFQNINKIEYIPNKDNYGISKAFNIAFKKAIENKYDWMITMDEDSKFDRGAIDIIKDYINQNDTGDVGVIAPSLSKFNDSKKEVEYPEIILMSGNFVNLDVLNQIGGFNEKYFIDSVDHEFCLRVQKCGYKVIKLNKSHLIHSLGDETKKRFLFKTYTFHSHSPIREYYMCRNRLLLFKEYKMSNRRFCKNEKRAMFRDLLISLVFEKKKMLRLRYIFKGISDYKKGKFGRIDKI